MYDAPGSDQKHEWLELTNLSTGALDLSGYSLFEGGTNHKLVVVSGRATIVPAESVIVVEDLKVFQQDWPQYAGSLFKATFSLSNSGEALSIKDKALHEQDNTFYTSSMGGQGDGNSLHRRGSSFIAAPPDPGKVKEIEIPAPKPKQAPAFFTTPSPLTASPTETISTTPASVPTTSTGTAKFELKNSDISSQRKSPPIGLFEGIAGLVTLLVLTIIGLWYTLSTPELVSKEESFLTADEFEIE